MARKKLSDYMKKKRNCKFCKIVHDQDRSKIYFENNHIVVVQGRDHHKGHLIVMPRTHEEHIMMLHQKTLEHLMDGTILVCKALHKAINFDRLNFEYLDNWDPHIHINVYPRFKTDKDWGNPPEIPKKGKKYIPKPLSEKEIKIFERELAKIKRKL